MLFRSVFETVLSDPVGDKLEFLREAVRRGCKVVVCFIGISSPEVSEERVAMSVSQGGHDVPSEKLQQRFPRTLANLRAAIRELPHVVVFDNDDLSQPFRKVAPDALGLPREVFQVMLLPLGLGRGSSSASTVARARPVRVVRRRTRHRLKTVHPKRHRL